MTTFLFWNINKKPLGSLLRALVDAHAPDLIALAECQIPIDDLLATINSKSPLKYRLSPDPKNEVASRLVLLTRLPHTAIRPLTGSGTCAVRHIRPILGDDLLMLSMHLLSKMHANGAEYEQAMLATRLRLLIDAAESKVGHRRSVVMGDLNMGPHEPGVTSAEALHGVTERHSAEKSSRVVYGEERFYFYNPLPGQLLTSQTGPPGTYYRPATGTVPHKWHIFDQVLIRPGLLHNFSYQNLSVLTSAGKTPLLTSAGYPNRKIGSDHLPLLFKI